MWTCTFGATHDVVAGTQIYLYLTPKIAIIHLRIANQLTFCSETLNLHGDEVTLCLSTFLGAFAKLRNVTISFVMSVCPLVCTHATIQLQLNGFLWNLLFEFIFQNLPRKFKFQQNPTSVTDTLHDDQYALFLYISFSSSKNKKCFRQNLYRKLKHFVFNNFFRKSCRFEIMWKHGWFQASAAQ